MPGKVLILSPKFPPKSAADIHRVRTSLGYYRSFGWEPTVLCIAPESSEGVDEPLLAESLPGDADIVRVAAWDEALCRRFGFGLLEYRALWPLYRAGNRLLREGKYDVIFFSTTAFLTLVLGPIWKKKFGCKIVYDIQDPWYHGKIDPYDRSNAPGGWNRYRLAQFIAKHAEAFAMRDTDGIISVSQGYIDKLIERYEFLDRRIFSVIPFGVADGDYEIAQRFRSKTPRPVITKWVSVGRAGADMNGVLETFFAALAELKQKRPDFVSTLRVDFIGTNYASAARSKKLVAPIAAKFGLEDIVTEKSQRIPYFEALASYADSHAILLFGSTSPDYVPSKLFNCLLAKKPILAMLQQKSFVAEIAAGFPNVHLSTFFAPDDANFKTAISDGFGFLETARIQGGDIDRALEAWSAKALSEKQCRVFDSVCADSVKAWR